jgi:hypothetical protein
MRASYRKAIEWIAMNDEPDSDDRDFVAGMISTMLVADLFGKTPETVAQAVIRYRKRNGVIA